MSVSISSNGHSLSWIDSRSSCTRSVFNGSVLSPSFNPLVDRGETDVELACDDARRHTTAPLPHHQGAFRHSGGTIAACWHRLRSAGDMNHTHILFLLCVNIFKAYFTL